MKRLHMARQNDTREDAAGVREKGGGGASEDAFSFYGKQG